MKEILRRLAHMMGYEISFKPRFLIDNPDAQYRCDPETVLARAILANPAPHFVQIGAFDGMANDPIQPFRANGKLTGIVVEPQPDMFEKLTEAYAGVEGVTLENCAIGDTDGELVLYRLKDAYLHLGGAVAKQLTSPIRSKIEDFIVWDGDTDEVIETIAVPSYTVNSLLAKHGRTSTDILVVDTEGYDYIILKSAGLDQLKPTAILYEHKHLSPADQMACNQMLADLGYKLMIHYVDTIAVDPEKLGLDY